jgi:hypothetical protein
MDAFIDAVRRRSPIRRSMSDRLDNKSVHPDNVVSTELTMSWPSHTVTAMLRRRTAAVARLAVAAVVTMAVGET